MSNINDAIKEMVAKHVDFVEKLLEALPEGSILCVHEAEFQSTIPDFSSVNQKFISRIVSHVIEKPDDCKARIMRTQYGPK